MNADPLILFIYLTIWLVRQNIKFQWEYGPIFPLKYQLHCIAIVAFVDCAW